MTEVSVDSRRIGREVQKLRKQLKLSSTALARKVGLSQPQISRLENGLQGFRSDTLSRISDALGVTPAYFFAVQGEEVQENVTRVMNERYSVGRDMIETVEGSYSEIAINHGYRTLIKRLARLMSRDNTDLKVLRLVLKRVIAMNNDERKSLLDHLESPDQEEMVKYNEAHPEGAM